ncbi:MAG: thioesterase family protein [Sporolactobacillus sp.]
MSEHNEKQSLTIEKGMTCTVETQVDETMTADRFASGALPVYGTPAMIGLMEHAACECLSKALQPGQTSVGTEISIAHLAATPVGATVKATATVTAVDRRKIVFDVSAYDNAGKIGEGKHARFIVASEPFMAKAEHRV